MRVFVIHIRSLMMAVAVFLFVMAAGLYLLISDPLEVSEPFRSKPADLLASAGAVNDPFASVKPSLDMDVRVDGDTAHVKLIAENFAFTSEESQAEPRHGRGHAHLYLNGKLFQKVYQPEFLLKRLPKGTHEFKVELVYSNHMPYRVEATKILEVK